MLLCTYGNWYRIQTSITLFYSFFSLHKRRLLRKHLLLADTVREGVGMFNQFLFEDSKPLLQEIDRKMSIMESILLLHSTSGYADTKEVYKVHQILLEMSNLLLILEQEPKMASLAKELSLQLQTIQKQYNKIIGIS